MGLVGRAAVWKAERTNSPCILVRAGDSGCRLADDIRTYVRIITDSEVECQQQCYVKSGA